MDINISVQKSTAENTFAEIETEINSKFTDKQNRYSDITSLFSKSKGEQVDAIIQLLQKEQETIGKISELFSEIISMLRAASTSLENVEDKYSVNHVENSQ